MEPDSQEYLEHSLRVAVESGYDDAVDLMESFGEQLRDEVPDASDALVREWLTRLEQSLVARAKREAEWTERSTNDRITDAFDALGKRGVVALEDAGYTNSDGWSDVHEAREDVAEAWGGVFFHRQDVEAAIEGEGLMLTFGAFVDTEKHEAESERLGHLVCDVLREYGVTVEWDGTVGSRIQIGAFEWRKRRHSLAST